MHRQARPARPTEPGLAVHLVNLVLNVVGDDLVSRWIRRRVLTASGADISVQADLVGGTYFSCPRNLRMASRSGINHHCFLDLRAPIVLEAGARVGHGTMILTTTHAIGPRGGRRGVATGLPVTIGAGAWIGANVTILAGVTIGAGSIVAVASVVTSDVAPGVLVAGAPARLVRVIDPDGT